MIECLSMKEWSPYLVGAGIGVLNILAFLLSDKPIGCSTAYTRASGMIERLLRGSKVNEKAYYRKFVPVVDWEVMLLAGIVLGAFLSANLSGEFRPEMVPALWRERFGSDPFLRIAVAFAGGVLLGLGARWAGGCTSGHGISGTTQLAASSWLAVICFFIGGIATAMILFGAGG
ncbi:MAG: YeeE/YedE thiosulfate transporter family protein [Methanothrix sp.]|nr:YeeE/YedE family protein [Methanothrix harundinacea]MDD2638412.1 YeeE/YedE thiosulfate transporter family protein [Methanothrix sp.]MDD3710091.1 YeeE/YedE thiosulfate transporter family protein [Methanothrix sp.]MDI9399768.1 YeeE/YedE thiosulfate transporter family protein [Euryarchaeota archaeon]